MDIKFRGKDEVTNEWVYGYYCKTQIGIEFITNDKRIVNKFDLYEIELGTAGQYINYKDIYNNELYTNDIIYYHRHEGSYSENRALDKLGVILWDDRALGYRIFPIDTYSYKINRGVDGEKIKTSHRIVKVGNKFDNDIRDLVETYL